MATADPLPPPCTDLLWWSEIQARFPYQYVLIVDDESDITKGMAVLRGRVVSHGKFPEDVLRYSAPYHDAGIEIGLYYTGIGMPDEDRDEPRVGR